MKKETIFKGAATALMTPFKDGNIDYGALGELIDRQTEAGIAALVIGGTTGEAATLDDRERYKLFEYSQRRADGKTKLIFGTGTNDTKKAVMHSLYAKECGCDGILVVTPYYNKGTERGIVRHYFEIAEKTDLPTILYNVPTRTGVNLTISQLRELAACEHIVAIKEASDSMERMSELSLFGEELYIYAGCDQAIQETLSVGGIGVISVVSNLYPCDVIELCNAFFDGRTADALNIQRRLLPIINLLFRETNPAPLKYAASRLGLCKNELRLPLAAVKKETESLIDTELARLRQG